jgi:hypothetical protein
LQFLTFGGVGVHSAAILERDDPTSGVAVLLGADALGSHFLDEVLCDSALHLLGSLNRLLAAHLRCDLLFLLGFTERRERGEVGVRCEDGQKHFRR